MEIFGIDISTWQRNMDLNTAKNEGVKFAIIRGMYGNAKDVAFESNYQKAKASGLGIGAYQWGRAKNEAQAKEEAQLFIEYCLQGKQFDYPIYYDVEDSILINLSVEELTKLIEAWASEMESHGYFVGIYMNQSAFNSEVNGSELAKKYSQWRAYWTTKDKKPTCQMWQFGGETNKIRSNKIANVVCDQDYAYEDFPSIIKNGGFNGYAKGSSVASATTTTQSKKSNEEIANEVIQGKWGNGQDRINKLTQAGYDSKAIQDIVNQKLGVTKTQNAAVYYTIKQGDNLTKIAKKYGTSVNALVKLNGIADPDKIIAGKKIRVK